MPSKAIYFDFVDIYNKNQRLLLYPIIILFQSTIN